MARYGGVIVVGVVGWLAGCAEGSTLEEGDDGAHDFGGSSAGGAPTTAGTTSAGGATTNAGGATSSASSSASSTASSSASSSSVASSSSASSSAVSSSSSGMMMCPPPPTNVTGCASCAAACDSPWNVSWSPVVGATHYLVEYTCFINMVSYQTAATMADLCNEVGMCNDSNCAFGAGAVTVKACDLSCCSSPVTVPSSESPTACGGGVCC